MAREVPRQCPCDGRSTSNVVNTKFSYVALKNLSKEERLANVVEGGKAGKCGRGKKDWRMW